MIIKEHKNNKQPANILNEFWDPFDEKKEMLDKTNIKGVTMNDAAENQCKIKMQGKNVVANEPFYTGDIVEIAPCKIMDDTYTIEFIKDLVFEIPGNKYAIPFGYVQFYEINGEDKKANCDYLYDPNMEAIIIKATKTIKPGDKLVLFSNTTDEF